MYSDNCLLTVLGLMANLPSPSPRLYSMRAKLPESASVAVTLRMTVPTATSSKTASYRKREGGGGGGWKKGGRVIPGAYTLFNNSLVQWGHRAT